MFRCPEHLVSRYSPLPRWVATQLSSHQSLARKERHTTSAAEKHAAPQAAGLPNLLIPAQPQLTICAALSGVFSTRAGARGTEDFGTAGQTLNAFLLARDLGVSPRREPLAQMLRYA